MKPILVAALLASVAADASALDGPRPNLLLLVAEDMSARVGAFGDRVAVTPNLDALATEGVRYPNTFTTAGVCAPSRAALITGVHQNAIGAGHMRSHGWSQARYKAVPPPEVKAFPELLRAAGYFTYATSKLDYQFSGVLPRQGPSSIWDAEALRGDGVSWSDRPDGAPFFGMYAYMETHESGVFPRDVWPRSLSHLIMMVLQTLSHWNSEPTVRPEDVELPPYLPDTAIQRRDLARHYDDIVTMDRKVGALLAHLDADGLADDTIVIWTTDHGDGLPRAKRELFDSGTRVPMIIRWPERFRPAGVEPGTLDPRLISFVDLGPILLAMAGLETPAFMHGRDVIGGGPAVQRSYVYAARDRSDEADDQQRSVRDARYRYIRNDAPGTPGARHLDFRDVQDGMRELWDLWEADRLEGAQRIWFEPRPRHELYDTQTDPYEIHNLADDPSHHATLERLQHALDAWQEQVPDLGAIAEAELAERSWPGGEEPVTAAPEPRRRPDGRIAWVCATDGASIEYRIDGGRWRLYTDPLSIEHDTRVEARAVRYGWAQSDTSRLE